MKIAAITDDGKTLSAHFGRARHFQVYTVENGAITSIEVRDKVGHDELEGGHHEHHDDHDHHEHHEHDGHGFGHHAGERHTRMMAGISDCDVLLARGMGQGAYQALQAANIVTITTEIKTIDGAVQAYLAGEIVDRPNRRH